MVQHKWGYFGSHHLKSIHEDLNTLVERRIAKPWSVRWFIDLGWFLTRDTYLAFNNFFPERVRCVGMDIRDFWDVEEQILRVPHHLLANPHVTTLRLKGLPPMTEKVPEGFPDFGTLFKNLRYVHLPFFNGEDDGDSSDDDSNYDDDDRTADASEYWAPILPKDITLILPRLSPNDEPWDDFRELRLTVANMWERCDVGNMWNMKTMEVHLRGPEDVFALLPGAKTVEDLIINCDLAKHLSTEAVQAIAVRIPDLWENLKHVRFRGTPKCCNRHLFEAMVGSWKSRALPFRITRSDNLRHGG